MNEHDYIKQLIVDRWWGEVERQVYPLQDKARQNLYEGQRDSAIASEAQVMQHLQQLMNDRAAAEERLRWLLLDAALRREGKNYPDVYEGLT